MILSELASTEPPWGIVLKGTLIPAEINDVLNTSTDTDNMAPTPDPAIPCSTSTKAWVNGSYSPSCSTDLQQKQVDITSASHQACSEGQGEEKRWWECWTRLDRKKTKRKREKIARGRKESENMCLKTSTKSQLRSSQTFLRQYLNHERH